MNAIVLKKTPTGYNVFINSNEIDTGSFKTSYIYLGKTSGVVKQYGDIIALVLS